MNDSPFPRSNRMVDEERTGLHTGHVVFDFTYRRPILCTLYGAVDFLKVLKIAVVGGGGVLLDGWEEVLGRNVYITSHYFFYD
jgi:hypothetical protein